MRFAPSSETAARAMVGLAAFAVWAAFAAWHAQVKAADFYVFWTAGRHWAAPYDPALITALQSQFHFDGRLPFVYPPTFLLVAWPFGQLPLSLAYPLWTGLSAALFMFAAARLLQPAWLTLALFIVPPVVLAISPGQTSLIVGAAAISGFQLLKTRPALAGALFGLAAAIKPQAMLLAPLVLWGEWRALRWAAITGLSLALASLAFGPGLWFAWLAALRDFGAVAPATDRINPSALTPLLALPLAALGLWIAWKWRDLTGLVAGGLCLTPYAHQYDLAPLAPAALSWIATWRKQGLGKAALGGMLLAGAVATPLLGFVWVLGLGALPLWRKLAASPSAVTPAESPRKRGVRAGAGPAGAQLDIL